MLGKDGRRSRSDTNALLWFACSSLKRFLKVTEVRKAGRMVEQMELWQIWFKKELRERNEQSQVDNNEPYKVQMLIKCFESLGCFASVGT